MNEKAYIKLQKAFEKIYFGDDEELIALDANHIHVTNKGFSELIERYSDWVVRDNTIGYTGDMKIDQWIAEIKIDGVLFITVGNTDEFQYAGIPTPEPLTEEEK